MFDAFITALKDWNKKHDSRAKLQHTYAVVALAVLVLAGIISLVNYNFGQSILFVAIVMAFVFVVNAVVWALLQSFVIERLKRPRTKK